MSYRKRKLHLARWWLDTGPLWWFWISKIPPHWLDHILLFTHLHPMWIFYEKYHLNFRSHKQNCLEPNDILFLWKMWAPRNGSSRCFCSNSHEWFYPLTSYYFGTFKQDIYVQRCKKLFICCQYWVLSTGAFI